MSKSDEITPEHFAACEKLYDNLMKGKCSECERLREELEIERKAWELERRVWALQNPNWMLMDYFRKEAKKLLRG